jgi:hypothetical protein
MPPLEGQLTPREQAGSSPISVLPAFRQHTFAPCLQMHSTDFSRGESGEKGDGPAAPGRSSAQGVVDTSKHVIAAATLIAHFRLVVGKIAWLLTR